MVSEMRRITTIAALLLVAAVALAAGRDTYTVIVSLDGLRWDYPEAFDAPFFDRMAREGVKAVMSPSFPSKTLPNHYTLATGLVPDHHGIIGNSFKDRSNGKYFSMSYRNRKVRSDSKYYGGEPVWITAKHQGVKTATVYWVGSDVNLKGGYPDYWTDYNKEKLSHPQRIDEVLRLLQLPESERPHLVMCYFEEPDGSGHHNGPMSKATRQKFEQMDSLMTVLWDRLQQLDIAPQINLIVTGDHGMTWTDGEHCVSPTRAMPVSKWVDIILGDAPANIYVKKQEYVDSVLKALEHVDHIRAWRKTEVPEYLNYGTNENVGDVVVLPDVGWLFTDRNIEPGGNHGFDHTSIDMQVAFRAIGPDFKRGYAKPNRFPNVDIYPLLCYLLGIKAASHDGDLSDLNDILVY